MKEISYDNFKNLKLNCQISVGLSLAFGILMLPSALVVGLSSFGSGKNAKPETGKIIGGIVLFVLGILLLILSYNIFNNKKCEKKCNVNFWVKNSSFVTFPSNLDEESPDITDVNECEAQKYAEYETDSTAFILKKKEDSLYDAYMMNTDKKFDIKCSNSDKFTIYTVKSGDRKSTANISTGCSTTSPAPPSFPNLTYDTASNSTKTSFTKLSGTSYKLTLTGEVGTPSNTRGDAPFAYFTVPYSNNFSIEADVVFDTDFQQSVSAGFWVTSDTSPYQPIFDLTKVNYPPENIKGIGSRSFTTESLITSKKAVTTINLNTSSTIRLIKIGNTFRGQYKNSLGNFINICDTNISRLFLTNITNLRVGIYMNFGIVNQTVNATFSNLKYNIIPEASSSSNITINNETFDQTGYTFSNGWLWNRTLISNPAPSVSTSVEECKTRCENTPSCVIYSRATHDGMCNLYSTSDSQSDTAHIRALKKDGTKPYSKPGYFTPYYDSQSETDTNKKTYTIMQCKQACDSNCGCVGWYFRTGTHSNPSFRNTCTLWSNLSGYHSYVDGFVHRNTIGTIIEPSGTATYF